eukprot:g19887.t1
MFGILVSSLAVAYCWNDIDGIGSVSQSVAKGPLRTMLGKGGMKDGKDGMDGMGGKDGKGGKDGCSFTLQYNITDRVFKTLAGQGDNVLTHSVIPLNDDSDFAGEYYATTNKFKQHGSADQFVDQRTLTFRIAATEDCGEMLFGTNTVGKSGGDNTYKDGDKESYEVTIGGAGSIDFQVKGDIRKWYITLENCGCLDA